jgi:ferric-dicitrate binding protein FerR (iron transport regulator)
MSNQPPNPDDLQRADDAGIEQLLRNVGARDEPSQAMADEVRRAVHAQWQSTVRSHRRSGRWVKYGMAAAILGVVITAAIAWQFTSFESDGATIVRIEGSAELIAKNGRARAIAIGQRIAVGEVLRTGSTARVALDFGDGVSARIDRDSELAFAAEHHVRLIAGAAYVDATPDERRVSELVIDTTFGGVRHVGTQYQVRIVGEGMEIGIREGRVEVTSQRGTNVGEAGELLRLSAAGDVARRPLPAFDASWQWITTVSPAFSIDNRPLGDFLSWAARETGRTLSFENAGVERAAAQLKLRGSIEGLDVNTALTAVLSTTQFKLTKDNAESMHVSLASD